MNPESMEDTLHISIHMGSIHMLGILYLKKKRMRKFLHSYSLSRSLMSVVSCAYVLRMRVCVICIFDQDLLENKDRILTESDQVERGGTNAQIERLELQYKHKYSISITNSLQKYISV